MSTAKPGLWFVLWAVVNVVLGIVLAYPFLFLLLIGVHARAMLFDRPDSPFSPKEIEGGEADGFIPFGIIASIVIVAVLAGTNWAMIRRMRLPSPVAKAGVALVSAALIAAPALMIF